MKKRSTLIVLALTPLLLFLLAGTASAGVIVYADSDAAAGGNYQISYWSGTTNNINVGKTTVAPSVPVTSASAVPVNIGTDFTISSVAPRASGDFGYVFDHICYNDGPASYTLPVTYSSGSTYDRVVIYYSATARPVANNDYYNATQPNPLHVDAPGVLANDTGAISATLYFLPIAGGTRTTGYSGSVTLSTDGSFDYTPATGFVGRDYFPYYAYNGTFTSKNQGWVYIVVADVKDLSRTMTKNRTISVIAANGVNSGLSGTPTAHLDTDASNGTLVLDANGSFTYTPNTGYTGTDSFTYHSTVGTDTVRTGTVTFTVVDYAVNHIPTAGTVIISPDPAYTGSLLTATPSGFTDEDGDSLAYHYAWEKNGAEVGGDSSTLDLSVSGNGDKNDLISVTCYATDGIADSGNAPDSVTVSNSAPTTPTVDVTPNAPSVGDDLSVSANSTDPDGDAVTYHYAWYKNGTVQPGLADSTTVDNSLTSEGDTWKCVVTPNDGTVNGATGDDSVTILTSADTTPDAFSFTSQNSVALSTLVTSNTVTISGINAAAVISVSNGEYQIEGGSWTSSPGTITNGQTVTVRHTSSADYSTMVTTTLTIGGVDGTFSSTTVAGPPVLDPANIPDDLPQAQQAWYDYTGTRHVYQTRLYVSWDKSAGEPTYLDVYKGKRVVAHISMESAWIDQGYLCAYIQKFRVGTVLTLRLGNVSGYDEESVTVINPPVS